MLERFRSRLSAYIYPEKASSSGDRIRVEGLQPPNIPVYTDMTVRKATREGYKISIYVYRAVRTIIQAASAVPWIVVDDNDEPIENHPLELVLRHPNSEFSAQDMVELLIGHLELVGNALWQPVRVGGQIKELWPVMPDLVHPIPSKEKGKWLKGWDVIVDGRHEILPPEQFIHFQQTDPGNPYWGISPLMAAARTVDTDNEAQDTQKISMQNRGIVDGVFTHEAPLTQEQFEEARRQVREKFLDKARRREPWVLGAGAKWNQMSLSPVEMDYIASRLANLRAIAAAFGLDPWWLGDRSTSTYNNVQEARRALYEDVVIPLLDDVESTINLRMSPLYGKNIRATYDLSGIPAMRNDFGQKVTQASALWSMGVPFSQINQRLEMGFEEFSGWDSGYLPMSLLPIGSERPEPATGEPEEDVDVEPVKSENKSLNLISEEAKTVYWKMIDNRRMGWWGVIAKRVEPLYSQELSAITKAISGKANFDEAEAAAARAIAGLSPEWEKMIAAVLVTVSDDFGSRLAGDLGAQPKGMSLTERKWQFDPFSLASRAWIENHGAEAVKTILKTNLSDVRKVILTAKDENLHIPQIGQRLRDFYGDRSPYKAMRIARTEVSAAAGFGSREAAKQAGFVKTKKWLTSRDGRVRDSHINIDGEERLLDETYSNGLMYPGDPGSDPAESIQCRCVEQYMSREPDVPKITPEDAYNQQFHKSISDFDKLYVDSKIENLQLIDSDGNLVGAVNKGGIAEVGLSRSQRKIASAGEASAAIHNHPNNVPIWIKDVEAAENLKLSRVVVTTKDGISMFEAPPTGWGGRLNRYEGECAWYETMGKKVSSARYGHEPDYLDLCHRANEAVAQATGWIYTRFMRSKEGIIW